MWKNYIVTKIYNNQFEFLPVYMIQNNLYQSTLHLYKSRICSEQYHIHLVSNEKWLIKLSEAVSIRVILGFNECLNHRGQAHLGLKSVISQSLGTNGLNPCGLDTSTVGQYVRNYFILKFWNGSAKIWYKASTVHRFFCSVIGRFLYGVGRL